MFDKIHTRSSSKLAISPVISSVIMTGAMIAILSVALLFANNLLWSKVSEGDFESSRELMHSIGLQIDDVAWIAGRTETIKYSTQYGDVELETNVLNYSISVSTSVDTFEFSNNTGVLMFNLPTYRYSISDGYWARIYPNPDEYLTLNGTSAPIARIFEIEKVPMNDGDYIRVVTSPSIRVLSSSINSTTGNTTYVRMYLPILTEGESPRLSQSITLIGKTVKAYTLNQVQTVSISVDFPKGVSNGFDTDFFNFPGDNPQFFDFSSLYLEGYQNVVLELYLSEVSVAFGL